MRRSLAVVMGILLLVSYGVAEGLWTDRWRLSDAVERAVAKLAAVPREVGEWRGQDAELDPRQVAQGEISGYLLRRYTHGPSRAEVSVLLVCGKPGPTTVHTPEVCYGGAGYATEGAPTRQAVSAEGLPGPADFWVGQFHKTGPAPDPLRICWAWNGTGTWMAPDNPRLHFATQKALYKLYVTRSLARMDEPVKDDPSLEFLREFLPVVQTALFAPTKR